MFKNTGANLVANFASGMPYSRQQRITGAALITAPAPILEGDLWDPGSLGILGQIFKLIKI